MTTFSTLQLVLFGLLILFLVLSLFPSFVYNIITLNSKSKVTEKDVSSEKSKPKDKKDKKDKTSKDTEKDSKYFTTYSIDETYENSEILRIAKLSSSDISRNYPSEKFSNVGNIVEKLEDLTSMYSKIIELEDNENFLRDVNIKFINLFAENRNYKKHFEKYKGISSLEENLNTEKMNALKVLSEFIDEIHKSTEAYVKLDFERKSNMVNSNAEARVKVYQDTK